jgi:hypothetical protein
VTDVVEPEQNSSAAHAPEHVAPSVPVEAAKEALKHGPRGALIIASVSVSLLILGWLAFYFFLFIPRGSVS